MRRMMVGVLAAVMVTVGVTGVGAQAAPAPIYLTVQGELLRTTADGRVLEPVAACALAEGETVLGAPVISPDGRLLALRIEPTLVSETRARIGGWAGGENPSDLAVCDPATGFVARVTQPADAALFDPNGRGDLFTRRSVPAWSPDSRSLAWTECGAECLGQSLVRYDLEANTPQTLATLPEQYGVPATLPVAWGGPLILVQSVTFDQATMAEDPRLFGFDPASGAQTLDVSTATAQGSEFSFVTDFFWANTDTTPRVVLLRSSGTWIAVDPATGEQSLLDGAPELVSPLAPDGVTAVADGRAAQALNLRWLARQGETLTPLGDDVRGFVPPSVAPDGRALVFYQNLTPAIWRDGAVIALPLPSLSPNDPAFAVWGPGIWRTYQGSLPAAETDFICFGAPPPRLQTGAAARVVEGRGANNLRAEPATDAELLGTLDEGTVFDVLDGPVCMDGYAWWQVSAAGGQTGWTAEGEGSEYWLEPAG